MRHLKTRESLEYLIKHEVGLRRYCEEGRLPISNNLSEYVAKTVAVARRNFLFADTPAGAGASALIYSVIESVKANGQNVLKYLTVILNELPGMQTSEEIEALLIMAAIRVRGLGSLCAAAVARRGDVEHAGVNAKKSD